MRRTPLLLSVAITIGLVAVFMLIVPQIAFGAACTWTGTTSTVWTDPTNWSGCGGVAPSTADSVTIVNVVNKPILAASTSVVGLTVNGGATLTIPATVTITATGDINNGAIITGTGKLTFSGATFTNNGTVSVAQTNFSGTTQAMAGSGEWSAAVSILTGSTTTFNTYANFRGSLTIASGATGQIGNNFPNLRTAVGANAGPVLTINGTLAASIYGYGIDIWGDPIRPPTVVNTGTQAGLLRIRGSGSTDYVQLSGQMGAVTVVDGRLLVRDAPLTLTGALIINDSIRSVVEVATGQTLTTQAAVTMQSSSTLLGNGTLQIQSDMANSGIITGTGVLTFGGTTFTNNGTVGVAQTNFSSATPAMAGSGEWTGAVSILTGSTTTFNTSANFRRSLTIAIGATGQIGNNIPNLRTAAGASAGPVLTINGTLTTSAGNSFDLWGDPIRPPTVVNNGTQTGLLRIRGNASTDYVQLSGRLGPVTVVDGRLLVRDAPLTLTGALIISTSIRSVVEVATGQTLTTQAAVTVQDSSTLLGSGTLQIQSDINNGGVITGTGLLAFSGVTFTNNGTVGVTETRFSGTTQSMAGAGEWVGAVRVMAGATTSLDTNGNFRRSLTIETGGTAQISPYYYPNLRTAVGASAGPVLTINGTLATNSAGYGMDIWGDPIRPPTVVNNGTQTGLLRIRGSGSTDYVQLSGQMGPVTVVDGRLLVRDAPLTLTGALNVNASIRSIVEVATGQTLITQAAVTVQGSSTLLGNGTLRIQSDVSNSGVITGTGILTFTGTTFTNSGTVGVTETRFSGTTQSMAGAGEWVGAVRIMAGTTTSLDTNANFRRSLTIETGGTAQLTSYYYPNLRTAVGASAGPVLTINGTLATNSAGYGMDIWGDPIRPPTVVNNGTQTGLLRIRGSGSTDYVQLSGRMGPVTVVDGRLLVRDAPLTLTGALNVNASIRSIVEVATGQALTTQAAVTIQGSSTLLGNGTLQIQSDMNNSGVITGTGVLTFTGTTFTNSGTVGVTETRFSGTTQSMAGAGEWVGAVRVMAGSTTSLDTSGNFRRSLTIETGGTAEPNTYYFPNLRTAVGASAGPVLTINGTLATNPSGYGIDIWGDPILPPTVVNNGTQAGLLRIRGSGSTDYVQLSGQMGPVTVVDGRLLVRDAPLTLTGALNVNTSIRSVVEVATGQTLTTQAAVTVQASSTLLGNGTFQIQSDVNNSGAIIGTGILTFTGTTFTNSGTVGIAETRFSGTTQSMAGAGEWVGAVRVMAGSTTSLDTSGNFRRSLTIETGGTAQPNTYYYPNLRTAVGASAGPVLTINGTLATSPSGYGIDIWGDPSSPPTVVNNGTQTGLLRIRGSASTDYVQMSGQIGPVTVLDGRLLVRDAPLTLIGALNINGSIRSVVEVSTGQTLTAQAAVTMQSGSTLLGSGTLQIRGDMTNSGVITGTGIVTFTGTTFTNSGTVGIAETRFSGTTQSMAGAGEWVGAVRVMAGSTTSLDTSGNFRRSLTIETGGTAQPNTYYYPNLRTAVGASAGPVLTINGTLATSPSGYGIDIWGDPSSPPTVVNNGTQTGLLRIRGSASTDYVQMSGQIGPVTVLDGRLLVRDAPLTLIGALNINGSIRSVVEVSTGQTLTAQAAVTMQSGSTLLGSGTLQIRGDMTNSGVITGTGIVTFTGTTFTNSGTVGIAETRFSGTTQSITGSGEWMGAVRITTGSSTTFNTNGNFRRNLTIDVGGTGQLTSNVPNLRTAAGASAGPVLTINGTLATGPAGYTFDIWGDPSYPPTVVNNGMQTGLLRIRGSASTDYVQMSGQLGPVSVLGGRLLVRDAPLTLTGALTMADYSTQKGVIEVAKGQTLTTQAAISMQSGTLLNSGTLHLRGDVTNSTVITGTGTLRFDGSILTNNGSITLDTLQLGGTNQSFAGSGSLRLTNPIAILPGVVFKLIGPLSLPRVEVNAGGTLDLNGQSLTLTGATPQLTLDG
ncbi:MAG: hypothetical protein WCK70_06215, partial [Chloroflexales bacterium]